MSGVAWSRATLAALFFLAGSVQAGSSLPVQDYPVTAPRASSPTAAVTVIPFELRDNLVRISVDVNGKPRSGVLDSGSSAVLIDRQIASELGLNESDTAVEGAAAGNDAKTLLPVIIARLEAGPFRFERLAAYSMDLGNLSSSAGFPVEVLLGGPAFETGTVTVDYGRRQVTVDRSGATVQCAAPIPLEMVHDTPVIAIEVQPPGERPVLLKVVVDLGTRHSSMILGGPFVRGEAGKRLLRNAVAKEIGFGVGGAVKGSVVRMAQVRAGAASFGPLEVSLTSDVPAFEGTGIDGSLGVPLWNGGVIAFDYARHRLCITPADRVGGSRSSADAPRSRADLR